MNEKMQNQVAEMKKQTIGVEVEMNCITRRDAARTAAEFFGTGPPRPPQSSSARDGTRIPPTATATAPGPPGMSRAASGSSSGTAASKARTMRSARW